MKILLIGFLALIIPCFADWTKPVKVINSYEANRTRPETIFTDGASGISHILWCHAKTNILHYKQLLPDGTTSKVIMFKWPYLCTAKYLISGLHDKKSLYIVFQGKKAMDNKKCTEDSKYCNDILFSQTTNGGVTWSNPVQVPRRDLKDKKDRVNPIFLVSKNNRLWIFYTNLMEKVNSISYVTRSPGSSVFSAERTLDIDVGRYMSVAYSTKGTKSTVSIFYHSDKKHGDYQYYSMDNGISWQGPVVFESACRDFIIYTYPFSTIQSPSHLFATCRDIEYYDYLSTSTDMGKTWFLSWIPDYTYMERYYVSGDTKGNGVFAYGDTKVYYIGFNESKFKSTTEPPLPVKKSCIALTSVYKPLKFWYWYEITNDDDTKSLWVSTIQIDKKTE